MTEPVPRDRPAANDHQAAAKLLDESSLSGLADAYCVIVVSPHGNPRRKIYLTLNHATAAVKRAESRGLPCCLVLCRLVPVAGVLDGRWTE